MDERGIKAPGPGALGAFGVPARRWATRVDLFEQIEAARAYLDSEALDALSIAEAAKRAGLSEFHFIRTFGDVVGKPPSEYIAERRLSCAAALLRETQMPVQQIAFDCGYLDPSAFARAFRRRFEVSPSGYRRRDIGVETNSFDP